MGLAAAALAGIAIAPAPAAEARGGAAPVIRRDNQALDRIFGREPKPQARPLGVMQLDSDLLLATFDDPGGLDR